MMPYNIKTEAGKALWNQMNQEQGSVVWGRVGEGIVAIEAEVEARIIKLLEDKRSEIENIVKMSDELGETSAKWFYQDRIRELNDYIALIKGKAE